MMYIVKYSVGQYDTYYEYNIFVTADRELAENYVEKFKCIIRKVKDL